MLSVQIFSLNPKVPLSAGYKDSTIWKESLKPLNLKFNVCAYRHMHIVSWVTKQHVKCFCGSCSVLLFSLLSDTEL